MTVEQFKKDVKLVLFDFDDTLCIHSKHYNEPDLMYHSAMLKGDYEWWTRRDCQVNKQMGMLLDLCYVTNKRMGLISAVELPITADVKLKWVSENYRHNLENFCTCSADTKLAMIQAIMNVYGYEPNEILFIDDYYKNIMSSAEIGVQAITCLEAVNFVNSISLE